MAADARRTPFDARVVAAVLAAGVLAFVAFLALSAIADDVSTNRRDGRAHALSIGATGYAGLVRLVNAVDRDARLLRDERALDTEDLVVVAVEQPLRDVRQLDRMVSDGGRVAELVKRRGARATLLVFSKWITQEHPTRPGWVRVVNGLNDRPNGPTVPLRGANRLSGLRVPTPAQTATVAASGAWRPILVTAAGSPVALQQGDRPLYVLADPDLLNNHGLRDRARAAAALALLAELSPTDARGIGFDLTVNGLAGRANPVDLLFEPPFLALTVALFVAALLAGLTGWARLGPERREARAVAFGKLALVCNLAGVIRAAGREHRFGAAYADLQRERALRLAGAGALPPGDADALLDRLSPEGERWSDMSAGLAAADGRDALSRWARQAHRWTEGLKR